MAANVAITQLSSNGTVVLEVAGEIDLATAPELQSRLDQLNAGDRIVVDLAKVTFIDSTGLRILITANEAAQAAGGSLAIVASEGPVTKLLSITGVDAWLDVHATRTAATGDG